MEKVRIRFLMRSEDGVSRCETEGERLRTDEYRFLADGACYGIRLGDRLFLTREGEIAYRLELDPARETGVVIATPYGELCADVRTLRLEIRRAGSFVRVRSEYRLRYAGEEREHSLSMFFADAEHAAPQRGDL